MTDSGLEFKIRRRRWSFVVLAVLLGLVLLVIINVELAKGIAQEYGGVGEVTQRDAGDGFSVKAFDTASVYTYYFPAMFRNYYVPVWEPLGFEGQNVKVIVIDPNMPGVLYAGMYTQDIYKSADFGSSWYSINNGLPDKPGIAAGVGIDSDDSQILYTAATYYPSFFYSQNGGQSWQPGEDMGRRPKVLSVHPMVSRCVFVGVGALPDIPAGGEVYKSDDGGLSWQMVITKQVLATSITASSIDPALVYAGGGGLYRSQDGGNSFARLTVGLPSPYVSVHAIALHPTNPLTAYVSVDEGVFKTTDGGDSWFSWGTETVSELLIDDDDPNTQYAVQSCAGVFVSRDEGKHWQSMGTGLGSLCVNDLAFDQASARLYAATEDGIWVVDVPGESK